MDVIAMRKTSGEVSGEIRLNGFLQERKSFLRCSGYVEQFDVQQAELTVWETVVFCARLRLDTDDPNIRSDRGKLRFVDNVLEIMELVEIQNLLVGSYEEGGLSFEQRKRLAIACELAGSPSVIFLDEPTSGLDSRGALLVMRAMKRISDTGRTVCATIHQPSSTVFEMFDDLLLLKKGGNVVFFGELGEGSCKLIEYLESRGASPIEFGENPAAVSRKKTLYVFQTKAELTVVWCKWMLSAYSGEGESGRRDWEGLFQESLECRELCEQIDLIHETPDETKKIHYDGFFPSTFFERLRLMNRRLTTVYKRSPAYNLTRMLIAIFYAFLIGSVFLRNTGYRQAVNQNEVRWNENQVDGVISTMYLSLIIIGFTSISMAVPVMKKMRDVFYKHRASGMLDHNSIAWSLMVAETPYLCLVSLLFGSLYYLTVGLFNDPGKFLIFWVFFALNVAIYSYFGQAFICLVKDIPTAGALVGTLVGYNIFFSGLVVKPQYFVGPFQLGFWTAPGRFALEGITMNQFAGITQMVEAQPFSPFYFFLGCGNQAVSEPCAGTIEKYVVEYYFGGRFTPDHFWMDAGCLVGYLFLARFLTWFALKKFNYVNT
jgi:ABC-type multidrug transport system ATPase subunit